MSIKEIGAWISHRLKERSSWLGLTAIIGSVGITISPELTDIIVQIGVGLAGLIGILTRDKMPPVIKK